MKIRMPNGTWNDVGTATQPINLRMPDGTWKLFGGGDGEPLYVRTPQMTWTLVTTAGMPTASNTYTYTYVLSSSPAGLPYAPGDSFRPLMVNNVGWKAERRFNYEYKVPQPNGTYRDDSAQRPLGEQIFTNADSPPWDATAVSAMGWIGNEFNTFSRYMRETVSWFPIPIGMFIADADLTVTQNSINNPNSVFAQMQISSVEVGHRLEGFSVLKSQVPWMNNYNLGSTTLGLHPGVGALRYWGAAAKTTTLTLNYNRSVYTIPTVRTPATFRRDTFGEILWTGNLNDLGMHQSIHGLPVRLPMVEVTQSFTPQLYGPGDALMYHLQTAPVPEPIPLDSTRSYTTSNYLGDLPVVRVIYEY